MRPYSHYLESIKSESIKAEYNLGGSTPPLPREWLTKELLVSQQESYKSPILTIVINLLAKRAGVPSKNIGLCPGGSQSAFQVLAALTSPGDKILIENPVYEPFVANAKFLNLKVKAFNRSGDFEKDLNQIQHKSKGCVLTLISNPHCPTGHLYSPSQLKKISSVTKLVVDEVFLPMFDNGQITRTTREMISIGGLSKSLGLSSPRVGWIIAAPKVLSDVKRIGYNLHIDMPTASLQIAELAINSWDSLIQRNIAVANENRNLVEIFDSNSPGNIPFGAKTGHFFTLKIPRSLRSGSHFANKLLKKSVWVRPGDDFGMDKFVRVGLLLERDKFRNAFSAIESFY